MPSRLSRFTDRIVTLAKQAVSGDSDPAVKKGDGGYADWILIVIHGLREYLDLPYRRLLDALHEMHGIVEKMDLGISELPDFTTVCTRKQQLKMAVWRTHLRLSADFHDTGDVQAIDATGFDRHSASRHYANRTFALKQWYGDTLRARSWFGQFRELVLKVAARNIELAP